MAPRIFLISELDGGQWSASRPGRFNAEGKSHLYPLNRKLGGSQSRSGFGGKEESIRSFLLPGIQSSSSSP
jgi:hypothetical protein